MKTYPVKIPAVDCEYAIIERTPSCMAVLSWNGMYFNSGARFWIDNTNKLPVMADMEGCYATAEVWKDVPREVILWIHGRRD
jgi:hypothetical protein